MHAGAATEGVGAIAAIAPAPKRAPGRRRTPTRPPGCTASWHPRRASYSTCSWTRPVSVSAARRSPSGWASRKGPTASPESSPGRRRG